MQPQVFTWSEVPILHRVEENLAATKRVGDALPMEPEVFGGVLLREIAPLFLWQVRLSREKGAFGNTVNSLPIAR